MSCLRDPIKTLALLFISLVVGTHEATGLFNLPQLAKSTKDLFNGIVEDIGRIRLTAEDMLHLSENIVVGYPFQLLSSIFNKICATGLETNSIRSSLKPELRKIKLQLRTTCNKYSYPLLDADKMWHSPEFDPTKKVVILATGWTTTVNDTDTIDALAKAYNCRGDVNFVALDVGNYVNTFYTWAALNTDEIGRSLAKGIDLLSQIVPLENIHLIGHSLGAHIVGYAGRYFIEKTGKRVPHITGLDPAKPCFNEGHMLSGLQRGDARFIDVIHSNPGVMGKEEALGDVDFYPGGLRPLPKGCLTFICAHSRAWEYYAESVYPGNELNFMARRCTSQATLLDNKCLGAEHPMGYAVSHELRGNYFLEVNSAAPFGLGASWEIISSQHTCGLCPYYMDYDIKGYNVYEIVSNCFSCYKR